jgi:hypothetical protein
MNSAEVLELAARLAGLEEPDQQESLILEHARRLEPAAQDELAQALKNQADQLMRINIQRCLNTARLIEKLSNLTGSPLHRALWLLAVGNAKHSCPRRLP